MKYNFTVRFHKPKEGSCLNVTDHITVSGITLISKPNKFDGICLHKTNQKKRRYKIELKGEFLKISGSNNYPWLYPKRKHVDVVVTNFPLLPKFDPEKHDYFYETMEILNITNCE